MDTVHPQRNSDSNIDYTQAGLFGFFISPKLRIEYEEKPESETIFCPAQRYFLQDGNGFERKFLRIRVRNIGYVTATNCEAKIRILGQRTTCQLVWEGSSSSTVLEGLVPQKNIRAKKGEELVHVVFSDSRFTNAPTENVRVLAWVSTMRSLPPRSVLSMADKLTDFNIEIEVLSDEGAFCKSKFRVYPDTNHLSLRMDKISDESGSKWSNIRKRMPF